MDQRITQETTPSLECQKWHKTVPDLAFNLPGSPFARVNLAILMAAGSNATTLAMFGLLCQASVQNRRNITPHPDWPAVLRVPKRSWFRALASLESKGLIDRKDGQIEL